MSGEPKTLTLQKCVWKRDPDGDSYVWVIGCTNEFSIQPDAEDYGYCPRCGQDIKLVTAPLEDHEGRWPEAAPSMPVVAHDEAAELREENHTLRTEADGWLKRVELLEAAIREWVEATSDAEMFELDQSNAYGTDHADAEDRVEAAAQALRRLAGGESER